MAQNTADDTPPDFLAILNAEDSEEEEEMESEGHHSELSELDELDVEEPEVEEYLDTEFTEFLEIEFNGDGTEIDLPIPSTSRLVPVVAPRCRSRSPLRWAPDAAAGSGSPPVDPSNVVVLAPLDDAMVENVMAEKPQQQLRPQRGGSARRSGSARRGGAARRGARGRGRKSYGQAPIGDPHWVIGDRLVKVHVDDDDVSEELKEAIMYVENAREAARVRLVNRERREREQNEEEFLDADDGEVESFFAPEGTSNQFEWSANMADFRGEREEFLPQQTGAVVASENAYGAFRQFWDEDLMTHIVTETNRHAARLAGSSASFARDWYDTNVHEIFVLFSFWMMLAIIRMPTISSCFASNPLLQTNVFKKMFSKARYTNLCRAFHLYDNSSRQTDPTDVKDGLETLGPIADRLNTLFMKAYIPSQNICIDESLHLWKGKLSFRQYIKTKAAQYGVKTFEVCESSTGYLWSFFIYRGAGTSYDSNLPSTALKSTTTVLRLIKPLLNKGYTLFMDNWFNSPLLARYLKTRKTDCVGTLRANRTDVPPLMSLCKLKEGQFVARHAGDVVVLTFQDRKRKIATISTYHGDSQGQMEAKPHRPSKYKPVVVLDYNKSMGGVDRKDSMLEPYLLARKRGKKWNIKFFKHLLNCSILNARILLQSSSTIPKTHTVFRLELVDQIMKLHHPHVPCKSHPTRPVSSSLNLSQPQVRHYPRLTDKRDSSGSLVRRRCHYCHQQNRYRRTKYFCSVCTVALCTDSCFEQYHAFLH